MTDHSNVNAKVLGQLLLMQSVVASLPDQTINHFVTQGLAEIPGIATVELNWEKRQETQDNQGTIQRFPLSTDSVFFGELVLQISDKTAFAPYHDQIKNFAFMLALILEERQQKKAAKFHKSQLELQVAERTRQLTYEIAEHKRTAEELQQTLTLLEEVINNCTDLIFVKNLELRTILCNKAYAEVLGKEPKSLYGHTDIENGWDPELVRGNAAKGIAGFEQDDRRATNGEIVHETYDLANTKAGLRIFDTIRAPLLNNDGKVMGVLGVSRDITDIAQTHRTLIESELKYRSLFENANVNIAIFEPDGTFMMINECNARLLGGKPEDFVGKSLHEVFPDQADFHLQRFARIISNKHGASFDDAFPLPDGVHWFSSHVQPLMNPCGQVTSIQIVAIDITERKKAEQVLQESERRFRDLLSNIQLLSMMLDAKGKITFCNDYLLKLTGWQREELIGESWFDLFVPVETRANVAAMFETSMQTNKIIPHHERVLVTKYGALKQIVWDNTMLRDEQGRIIGTASIGVDISERKQAEELIWKQANFDVLTNLPNRRMFHDRLGQEIKKAFRSDYQLALLFIDLDDFKEVNDTLGHPIGDKLLIEASQRIVNCVRDTDTIARLGGDEFTVLLTEIDEVDSVGRIAQEILDKLSEEFRLGQEVVLISASIGITMYPNDATDIDELMKCADQAMYAAKNMGRNRYSYFTPALQIAAQNRLRLINDLRDAITKDQLLVHFQPIINLSNGCIHKAEALVRWQHPERGLVSPADFIPLAEETGLIIEIGNWVFKESARWAKRWRSLYQENFQISVNKSPVQFRQGKAHDVWCSHMLDIGLPGQGIVIEITEGLLLGSDPAIMDSLLTYRDSGIQVAIDDFGTGYSSLSYLKKFDIDYLKIDRAFISNLAPGSSDMALSEAIIVMAHKLGLKVIAEGVETTAQRDLLVTAGCDYAQGFLFSRPIPPEAFEQLLLGQPGPVNTN